VPGLAPEDMDRIAGHLLAQVRFKGDPADIRDFDSSYTIEGVARFRVSLFRQMGHFASIIRVIPFAVPTFEQLGAPAIIEKITQEPRGLVLVTGVTGSGKTSTLAAMVDYLNTREKLHILTIEDPIEFLHQDKLSRVTQRELGIDTPNFPRALRAALRQDPDVILVGEMRDIETIEPALTAAETGHLVLGTLHTTDAGKSIGRILGAFPSDAQHSVRLRLAETLRAITVKAPAAQSARALRRPRSRLHARRADDDLRAEKWARLPRAGGLCARSFDQHLRSSALRRSPRGGALERVECRRHAAHPDAEGCFGGTRRPQT
jgi:twitching motility protein PilT